MASSMNKPMTMTMIKPKPKPKPSNEHTRLRSASSAAACVAGIVLFWLPGLAQACAVCFQGNGDASRIAFIATTAFMTFLPLAVLFLAIRWFVRHAREAEEADRAALLSRSRARS
jgi:hypothetical protein